MFHHWKVLTKCKILNLTIQMFRLMAEVETGLIPEIVSIINIKDKLLNVSEDSLRPTFMLY